MADMTAVRRAAHSAESHSLATYELLKRTNSRLATAVTACAACALVCLVCSLIVVSTIAQAAP